MKTIWKFPLMMTDRQTVEIPLPAELLTVQLQGKVPHENACLWAEVDPEGEKVRIEIAMIGTGHPVPEGMRYISTVQYGALVFHFYEVR
jgi:hypothetical protein